MAGRAFALPQARQEPDAPPAQDAAHLRAVVTALGAQIARMEERTPVLAGGGGPPLLTLGVEGIDHELALAAVPAAALHEIRAPGTLDAAAAAGFALALAARLGGPDGGLFWIAPRMAGLEAGSPFGPGIAALGLDPSALVRVETERVEEALWAAGEVAATPRAGVCLLELRGNPPAADLAFSRRLALRARDRGVPVVLLRQSGGEEASAAATRWRIEPARSRAGTQGAARKWVGPPAFRVTLEKCRGGRPGEWTLEWNNDERLFALAEGGIRRTDGRDPAGRRTPLPFHQPAQAGDRPDPARPSRSGLEKRSA